MGQLETDHTGVNMTSSKLLLVLMVAVPSMAAPQIRERQVVENVITQLQPAIAQALSRFNLGSSSSFSSPSTSALSRNSFSSISRPFSGATGATRSSFSSSSSPSAASLTSSVVSSLQPAIQAAVAQPLAGRSSSPSFRSGLGATGGAAAEPDSGPAQYNFEYKVADDEKQAYIAQQESRDGDEVTGSYNYVDPTGDLVTVNYHAGPEGYSEERNVEKDAVVMREIPGPWTGPLAGVDDVPASSGSIAAKNTGRGLSQSDLIAQIIAALQPNINSAVQSAISSSSTSASSLGQNSFATTRRARPSFSAAVPSFSSARQSFSSGQNNIVNSVVSSLQPRISSAVNSALSASRSRTLSVPRTRTSVPVRQASTSGSLGGLFGASGETNVRIETPEFQISY